MNNISEQILRAVEIVADEKISRLRYDKTIKATIWRIVDLDTGEYKVRYEGNIFSAFANDLTKTYKVDEVVYVTVPEGDFGNKKFISGTVTNLSLSDSQLTILQNSIEPLYPEFNEMYNGLYDKNKTFGVIAGTPPGEENSYNYIYPDTELVPNGLFQQYSASFELIRIKASFKTQFHSEHVRGNYGIEIVFYTNSEEEDNTVSYRLDLNSFNGDPYRLSVFSELSVVIKVQKNYLTGIKSIKLFEENFDYDQLLENGRPVDKWNTDTANIFAKDITIGYVEKIDYSDSNYHLTISATKGNTFTSNISSLDLMGRIIYQGKALDNGDTTYRWYERDLSVMIGEEAYDRDAGFGWKKLDETSSILTIDRTNVLHQQKYKLLVTYNKVVLTAETEIFVNNSGYDYSLVQTTDGDDIKLLLINNLSDEVLSADWYVSYPDDSYNLVVTDQNEIGVGPFLKYSSATFYCAVKSYDKTQVVGTLEKTIVSSASEEDVTISYIGEDSFRYDANGDITIEDSEKERTLQVKLAWKEGYGTSYKVKWYIDGKALIAGADRYPPSLSMLSEVWVDRYNILHYNIKLKYKLEYNNNTLQVVIEPTAGDPIPPFYKEILFVKDGDLGTNGTTYVIAVRPYDRSTGLKLSGFNPLKYNNGWDSAGLPLQCYVYKDGEMINGSPHYDIKYVWTGINIQFDEHNVLNSDKTANYNGVTGDIYRVTARGQGDISSSSTSAQLQFYVKVSVTITDKELNGRNVTVHASYPIDVLVGTIDASLVEVNIPQYIKYTSTGNIPSFYSNEVYLKYNNVKAELVPKNTSILTINPTPWSSEEPCYLRPASSFIFDNKDDNASNIGILQCRIDLSRYIIHPIVMYLDTYGNEAINNWDGTKLDIDEENGQYIFAPQIGAGEKDSSNRFTGVVMGKDSINDKIGLYGYQSGVNTFGLMETGVAYFGAKSRGGLIVIDGTTAKIYGGGNYPANSVTGNVGGDADNGMTLTLANLATASEEEGGARAATDAIKIGAGKFLVKYDGSLKATKATITGEITADSGKIGAWTIENTTRNPDGTITGGSIYGRGRNVELTSDGKIIAREGEIGGWTLNRTGLTSHDGKVGISSSSPVFYASGKEGNEDYNFSVSSSGKLTCTGATINGAINANSGTIGGWRITQNGLYACNTNWSDDTTYESQATFKLSSKGTGSLYIGNGTEPTGDISNNTNTYLRYSNGNLSISGNIRATNLYLGNSNIGSIIDNLFNGAHLVDNSVSSGKIGPNAVTAGKIAAGAVTAGTITADAITAVSGTIENIISKTVTAAYIYGKKVIAEQIGGDRINILSNVRVDTSGGGAVVMGDPRGYIDTRAAVSAGEAVELGTINAALSIKANLGSLYLAAGGTAFTLNPGGDISVTGSLNCNSLSVPGTGLDLGGQNLDQYIKTTVQALVKPDALK